MAIKLAIAALLEAQMPPVRFFGLAVFGTAAHGALSGVAFASVLLFAGRGRTLASLRASDMARWGAVGAVVLPAVSVALAISGGFHAFTLGMAGLALLQNSLARPRAASVRSMSRAAPNPINAACRGHRPPTPSRRPTPHHSRDARITRTPRSGAA